MIFYLLSKLITICFGMLYPAYSSYKAIKTKNAKEYVHWMMYWIVFAVYSIAETFLDALFGCWFPFYYELKIAFMFWMLSPTSKGGSILYRKFIHPALLNHEKEIDRYLADAKLTAENVLTHWGSRAISYAYDSIVKLVLRIPPMTQPQGYIQAHPSRPRLLALNDGYSSEIVDVVMTPSLPGPIHSPKSDFEEDYEIHGAENRHETQPFESGRSGKYPKTNIKPMNDKDRISDADSANNGNNTINTNNADADDGNTSEENLSSIPPAGIRKEARLAKQLKNKRSPNITTNSLRCRSRKIQ